MGAFFTNVQIRVGEDRRSAVLAAVLDALHADAGREGLVAAAPSEAADRSAIVIEGGGWISVYDEKAEDQSSRNDALAAALSAAVDDFAVSILMHDSSVLRMGLFVRGQAVDTYVNKPAPAGRPELWRPLLAGDIDTDALRRAWSADPVFAEELLDSIAKVLGFGEACRTGYDYLRAEESDAPPGARTELRFRARDRATVERRVSGPPRFQFAGKPWMVRGIVGETAHASLSVRNAGGESRGVRVSVWGDSVDGGLLALDRVELAIPRGETMSVEEAAVQPARYHGNKRMWSAEFDVPIAAAILPDERLPQSRRHAETQTLHVNVKPRVLGAGTGTLCIGFVPLTHPDGQFGTALPVHTVPAGEPLPEIPLPRGELAVAMRRVRGARGNAPDTNSESKTKADSKAKAKSKSEPKPK